MSQIACLALLPVRLRLALGGVGKTIGTRCYNSGYALTEPVSNILKPGLTALIFNAVVQKCSDSQIFIASIFQDSSGDGHQMRYVRRRCSLADLASMDVS